MVKQRKHPPDGDKSHATEQQLKAAIQQLRASEQQLRAANQQLEANNQQLRASEQQLQAANQQLGASEQQLRAINEQLQAEVSERKKAEEQIRQARQRAEQYLDIAGVMLATVDADEKISLINRKGCETLGYEWKELMGKNWFEILVPQRVKTEVKDVFHKLMAGYIMPVEYYENPLLTKKGEERLIAFHNTVIRDPDDKITGVLLSGEDITERKRTEEALRESEKLAAKGQLAAQIAHEINNPLAGIKNSFMLIKDAVPESHPYYRYVGLIEKEISRMSQVVHGMFELYRPDSEQPQEFSLDETVREVVELLGASYRQRNVLIGIRGRSAVVTLPESSLRQVLYNIVKNAIEASPAGGEVEISTKVTDDALTISVRDQGEGILEQARPYIFEPLFTTKRGVAGAGLGLGLSISKNIVESLGGSVYFESKTGEGTVFSIIIPLGKG